MFKRSQSHCQKKKWGRVLPLHCTCSGNLGREDVINRWEWNSDRATNTAYTFYPKNSCDSPLLGNFIAWETQTGQRKNARCETRSRPCTTIQTCTQSACCWISQQAPILHKSNPSNLKFVFTEQTIQNPDLDLKHGQILLETSPVSMNFHLSRIHLLTNEFLQWKLLLSLQHNEWKNWWINLQVLWL